MRLQKNASEVREFGVGGVARQENNAIFGSLDAMTQ